MVYENVLSVSFIYALGAKRGRLADPEEIIMDCINFFQQTPKDASVGDLLAKWNGKAFITEFKSNESLLWAELNKYGKVGLINRINGDEKILDYSKRGHFIGYGLYREHASNVLADMRFKDYISLLSTEPTPNYGFNQFTSKLIDEPKMGLKDSELSMYLEFLKKYAEYVTEEKASGSSSGGGKAVRRINQIEGVVTIIGPDANVMSLVYRSYQHLQNLLSQKITLKLFLDQQLYLEQAINESRRVGHRKSQQLNVNQNKGMNFGG